MGRTFKNITVSVTGEFGPISDKFKQWVEANGGSFSKEVNSGVTHLLSTKGAFKSNNNAGTLGRYKIAYILAILLTPAFHGMSVKHRINTNNIHCSTSS